MLDILIIGTVPHPIGGIASHVASLIERLRGQKVGLLDLHPDARKMPVHCPRVLSAPRGNLLRLFWIYWRALITPTRRVHLHVSGVHRIPIFSILILILRMKGSRVYVTLHSGNQVECWARLGFALRHLARMGLNLCSVVFSLSKRQADFYCKQCWLPWRRIVPITSYIRRSQVSPNPISMGKGGELRRCGGRLLVTSGYPDPVYGYEESLKVLDRLPAEWASRLVVCLYGVPRSAAYAQELQSRLSQREDVILLRDLSEAEFLWVLRSADVYLRPSLEDSYGLAVADAIANGTPAVASDVCERHPGAVLYPAGDMDALCVAVTRLLKDPRRAKEALGTMVERDAGHDILATYGMVSR